MRTFLESPDSTTRDAGSVRDSQPCALRIPEVRWLSASTEVLLRQFFRQRETRVR